MVVCFSSVIKGDTVIVITVFGYQGWSGRSQDQGSDRDILTR